MTCIVAPLHAAQDQLVSAPVMQIRAQSENDADDELLSVAIMKGDRKVVAGTQSGVVNLYSWGHMDDCSDRFPGMPRLLLCLLSALLLLLLPSAVLCPVCRSLCPGLLLLNTHLPASWPHLRCSNFLAFVCGGFKM